ncbi:MAG: hypothetical protein KAT48_07025 [Bacteroidales bacterium]|nr:hypothetical protein [Bacteroidales bacterium]
MIKRKIEKLVQRYLDGDVSFKEKKYVEELIRDDPSVKEYYEQMMLLEEDLYLDAQSIEGVNLKDDVLNEIQIMKMKKKIIKDDAGFFEKVFANTRLNIAYAFALGLIIGFFIFSPAIRQKGQPSIPESDLYGTISHEATTAFTLPIELPSVKVSLNADYLPQDFIRISMDISSEEQIRLRLSFNKDNFQPWNMKVISADPECRLLSDYNSVEVINKGENRYFVLLKKMNHLEEQIEIRIFSNDLLLYENIVMVSK